MPSPEDLDEALHLARRLSEPSWSAYVDFLELRGKGLRQPALNRLKTFIAQAQTWSFAERWNFASTVLGSVQNSQWLRIALPEPLVSHVLRPALEEALTHFPTDPRPSFWLGCENIFVWEAAGGDHQQLDWMREALRRDPEFQPARELFVALLLHGIAWAQHELPSGYLGQPLEDLEVLEEGQEILSGVSSPTRRQEFAQELEAAERTARQYLDFQKSGAAFYRFWCDENGLPYRY